MEESQFTELFGIMFALPVSRLNSKKCTLIFPCSLELFNIFDFTPLHHRPEGCRSIRKQKKMAWFVWEMQSCVMQGFLILFLSVMCSFSCWLVIQSLAVSATCSIFWALQSMWIKHMFQRILFYNLVHEQKLTLFFVLFFFVCFRSKPKEAFSARHVYRVGWHVCSRLWCKCFQFWGGK